MTEFKCLKAVFFFNFFKLIMEVCTRNSLHYVIIQKMMFSPKSDEGVIIKGTLMQIWKFHYMFGLI